MNIVQLQTTWTIAEKYVKWLSFAWSEELIMGVTSQKYLFQPYDTCSNPRSCANFNQSYNQLNKSRTQGSFREAQPPSK